MIRIRPATVDDVPLLLTMIRELAEFEGELEFVTIREEDLRRDGFGENPRYRAFMAEWNGEVAAYALVYDSYSTWKGRALFLEDLLVRPPFRGRGIGQALLAAMARIAVEEGCFGLHWEVLGWNQKAIDLYKAMGAEFRDQWKAMLLMGEPLRRLAAKAEK